MLRYALATAIFIWSFNVQCSLANSDGSFPGKGNRADWQKAGTLNEQATRLKQIGNLAEAERVLSGAISIYPYESVLYNNLGNCLRAQKKYAEAIQTYRKAIEIEPNYINAFFNLGLAYDKANDYTQAETWYRKTLQLNPDEESALFNLGAVLLDRGRYTEARTMFNRAGRCPSSNAEKIREAIREVDQKEAHSKKVKATHG